MMVRSSRLLVLMLGLLIAAACHRPSVRAPSPAGRIDGPDTVAILTLARQLADDSLGGRGPFSPGNTTAARILARELASLGGQPLVGGNILVPFVVPTRPTDTVYNVVAVFPGRRHGTTGELVGITGHLDGLGIGRPDADGDSIYNGFFDDALPVAMAVDVARRFAHHGGDRGLAVFFFNLEEQGLVGSRAFLARDDAPALLARLHLLVGADAGSPAGEPLEWQLMGTVPDHAGARLADSLAHARGWRTVRAAPRPISDVFVFSQQGVPIIFPIPGRDWRGYTDEERAAVSARYDRYHQPGDQWRPGYPLLGTALFTDWLWAIIHHAATGDRILRDP